MVTRTLALTEFLLARIAEDETAAHDVHGTGSWDVEEYRRPGAEVGRWNVVSERREWGVPVENIAETYLEFPYGGERRTAVHIARWDPARVLAECEAKRRIVDAHSSDVLTEPDEPEVRTDCRDCWQSWPCSTLRILAAIYADHPDYREEWRP